ncbi:xyloglucan endotransglucosylase protein 7-like [Rhododendron vialii]|uniref:xyloglucan endotransglucosylase protein 7-like n=1 Tax=Rhododendron vialii TaxID=182163 RepID=UPI0026603349|nr:xyloglucan endotransglucosylase protein 7-like [Rhododendron vialii]
MSSFFSSALLLVLLFMTSLMAASALRFDRNVEFYWGGQFANVQSGKAVTMSLYNSGGCGFQSYDGFLFGRFDMRIKLVPGNSAGTVTTYYISSSGPYHDEVDMEFLGNVTGQPYILHTNIFSNGVGGREQQFSLWFDPTLKFHKYSFIWNRQLILLLVDNKAVRIFNNNEAIGVPFPNSQAMNVYSSIWCGDSWATEGGRIKTNWADAPFTASFRNLKANACKVSYGSTSCGSSTPLWQPVTLNDTIKKQLARAQNKHMIYNYCTDYARFPQGFPPECYRPQFYQ